MNEKLSNKKIAAILLPFILVYIGAIYSNMNAHITSLLKTSAFVYMVLYVIYYRKFNKNLFYFTLLFIPFLIYGVYNSFYIKAGTSDAIRYLFPIVVLMYGYSNKKYLPVLVKFVAFFVVINFLVQITNYINWLRGIEQWFYYTTGTGYRYYNESSGIIRGTGLVVFFDLYGFFNLISIFIIKEFYHGKYKKVLIALAIFGTLASISYKTFFTAIVIVFFYYIKRLLNLIVFIIAVAIGVYYYIPQRINSLIADIIFRLKVYIIEGDSVRAESYRIMWQNIFEGNWFGRGIGIFGGPASTTYHSPYYTELNFNWYDTNWLNLPTTDTYPPHAFVELGIIGGLLYFLLILSPLLKNKVPIIIIIIYFTLFFDMLFSFSLNSLEYLIYSLGFVYPIYYYYEQQKT